MPSRITHISAISLFVEDLAGAKAFYQGVFEAPIVHEDATSVAMRFDNQLIVNLLHVDSAPDSHPGKVASSDAGSRCQFSVWVPDVDAVCEELQRRGVKLLLGPVDQPWGMRAASFLDPAGHSWEIAQ